MKIWSSKLVSFYLRGKNKHSIDFTSEFKVIARKHLVKLIYLYESINIFRHDRRTHFPVTHGELSRLVLQTFRHRLKYGVRS